MIGAYQDGSGKWVEDYGQPGDPHEPTGWLVMDAGDNVVDRGTDYEALERKWSRGVREGRMTIVGAD